MSDPTGNTACAKSNSLGPSDEILASPDTSVKLKKFTFTKDARLLLLKCVREHDAHLASHRGKDKVFDQV